MKTSEIYSDLLDKIPSEAGHILDRWFQHDIPENNSPYMYVRFLDRALSVILNLWVDQEDDEFENREVKYTINGLLQIKDDFITLSSQKE